MRKMLSALSSASLLLVFFFCASAANAQATRTWVSGVGDDANPCSRTAPCKTFPGAISKTAAGGEINCLDPGGFGAVTITKAITIDCSHTEGGVLVSGSNGVTVSAGASDVVTLRGLDFFGAVAPGATASNGILFNTGAALIVEKCMIRQFKTTTPYPIGFGIHFRPTAAARLYVNDTYITNNGSGSAGGAILVRPTGAGSAMVAINRVNADNNVTGITADGGSTTGKITIVVRDSVSSGAPFTGFSTVTNASSGTTIMFLDRSSTLHNATGISSFGPNSMVILNASTSSGNGTGLTATGGGQILSYGNNSLNVGNMVDGAPTGGDTLQ